MYKTLVIPIIDGCDIIYDCLTKRDSKALQRLQNGAYRIILNRNKRTPTSDMHKKLKLFRLADRRHLRTMEYMHKAVNELFPANICNYFKKVGAIHTRVTRSVTNQELIVPTLQLETSKWDTKYMGPL